jgi:hypothetical protein
MTAKQFQNLAAANGIKVSWRWARTILERNGALHMPGSGRFTPTPEIYDFVAGSPPMRSAELAQRFGITIKHASNILFQYGKILREKTITEIAKELPAPMTSREFANIHNCHISTAYEALKAVGKLIRSKNLHTARRKPKAPPAKPPPPPPPITRKIDMHPIAILHINWVAKQKTNPS